MQTTIKNLITKAVTEIESESKERTEPLSGNEFLEALFRKLFPEAPAVKKPRAKKEKAEEVKVEKVDAETKTVEVPTTPPAKKPRAKKAKEEVKVGSITEAVEGLTVAETPAAPAKKPRAKKEKGPQNLAKLTPTQNKKLKQMTDERKIGDDLKKVFLEYVNGMTEETYNTKKLEDHMSFFVGRVAPVNFARAPSPRPEEVELDRECIEVEFNDKTYYVSPEDNKVYEEGEDGVHAFVGYAGMAAFKGMKIPE